ncbi:MAG TPA: glycosyltransferase family 4 protein [Longimicrobium sp.]|jgi:glycosyltransferase involved in cell wall biosynthesis
MTAGERPLRILVLSQYFWPEDFRINDLALALKERGHHVEVLTGIPNYPEGRTYEGYSPFRPRQEEYHGIPVRRVPLLPRGGAGGVRLALNYASFALTASLLAPLVARRRYDVILVYEVSPITVGIPALVLKRLTGAALLFWVLDLWPEVLQGTGAVSSESVLGAVRRLARRIYRGSDRILVSSKGFLRPVAELADGDARVRYFPQSAESFYRPVAPEETEGVPPLPAGFRVMVAGNIGASQDFPTILAAAELLRDRRDVYWIVVGDGRMREWVEREVRERGLGAVVHLLGRHPAERMPHFFAHADVLLASLKRAPVYAYTLPAKVPSYLASARPLIAAMDGEGARVVSDARAGLSCPAEDPRALADAVLALRALSPEERAAMGARGRDYFLEHFERERLTTRLEGWMREVAPAGLQP